MNWLRLIPYAGLVFVTAALTWHLADWRLEIKRAQMQRELEAAVEAEREACANDKATTKEVSDALQKQLQTVNARHADAIHRLLRHEAAKRVQPANAPLGDDEAAAGDGFHRAGTGVDGLGRLERAAAAETQTQQLIACQDYVRRITK